MVPVDGYISVMKIAGFHVQTFTLSEIEMKKTRIEAAIHMFKQWKKAKRILENATFNDEDVQILNIKENGG